MKVVRMYSRLIEQTRGLVCTFEFLFLSSLSLSCSLSLLPCVLPSFSHSLSLFLSLALCLLFRYPLDPFLSFPVPFFLSHQKSLKVKRSHGLLTPFRRSRRGRLILRGPPLPRKSSLSSLISRGFRAFRGEIVSTTKGLKLRAESITQRGT